MTDSKTLAAVLEPARNISPILQVEELEVDFHTTHGWVRVVDGVTFVVPPGTTVGMVGESGSGKTVTSLAVMGLLPPDITRVRGSIRLCGQELIGLSKRDLARLRGSQMSMVFQEPRRSLDPAFTVGHQIAEAIRLHESMTARQARLRAIELLTRVGIADPARRVDAYPHQFSGGMCQRVMLAIALACRPRLLIADEPTTALDVTVQKEMLALINELQDELDVAILFITHDLGVVAQMCDWVNVMYAGQIAESTPIEWLFRRPRHPYSEGLLAAIPGLAVDEARLQSIPGAVPPPWEWQTGCRFSPRCAYAQPNCEEDPISPQGTGDEAYVRCIRAHEIDLTRARS